MCWRCPIADHDRPDWLAGGRRRDVAVDRIHAAATALILERGIEAVNVDDVAARAGCSRATLYRHVGGKAAIVDGVIARAAASVAGEVAIAIEPFDGSRRTVEAILASVAAVRTNPVLAQWYAGSRATRADSYLAAAPQLGRFASALTGVLPDDAAAQWIVRVVMSLLAWPLPDPAGERLIVERFVEPGLR
ncbi:TetR family transcriptional regulator [Nocardia fluminea]|uniref:TetR family transcriptional regulator n=1 Tax=Nocardia fluminea TaxID=134984 RepID=A0A2N3VJU8_9NOCA|nr:TetR family transcriptional regulator [Nocardia fluminea]